MTWDACRYLRDIKIVEVAARLYWVLIRFATLNRLRRLQSESLCNARHCRHICTEERMGKTFPEAHKQLTEAIVDALDAFDCDGYEIKTPSPKDLTSSDLVACVAILKTGDARLEIGESRATTGKSTRNRVERQADCRGRSRQTRAARLCRRHLTQEWRRVSATDFRAGICRRRA